MKTNYLKLGVLGLMMMVGTTINAQQTSGDATAADGTTKIGKIEDKGKSKELNGTVRVIDNKGTKKFLQVKNGLTLLTDTTPAGGIISTWQLGGTLTDATNITTGGKEFKITLDNGGGTFVLDGIQQETGTSSTSTTIGTSGFTLLVRDEATGQIKKMLATDLVSGIRTEYIQGTTAVVAPTVNDAGGNATNDVVITVNGLPTLNASTTLAKLFVYRNGVKLRSGTDFVATQDKVTITYDASELPMYSGDVIEIQYIK